MQRLKGRVVRLKTGTGPLMVAASDEDKDGDVVVVWGVGGEVLRTHVKACCLEPAAAEPGAPALNTLQRWRDEATADDIERIARQVATMPQQGNPHELSRREHLVELTAQLLRELASVRAASCGDSRDRLIAAIRSAEAWPGYYQELREAAEAYFGRVA